MLFAVTTERRTRKPTNTTTAATTATATTTVTTTPATTTPLTMESNINVNGGLLYNESKPTVHHVVHVVVMGVASNR